MYPYNKYVVTSLLRGKTPKAILRSLRNVELANIVDFSEFKYVTSAPQFKQQAKTISKIASVVNIEKHTSLLDSHGIYDYIYAATVANTTWEQLWDVLSVKKHRRVVVALLTMRQSTEDTVEHLNKKYSTTYTVDTINMFKEYFWDISSLSNTSVIRATENLLDTELQTALFKILDGNKYSGTYDVNAATVPGYTDMLEEMLADAYAKYNDLKDKKDPASRTELKVWLDVIVKIGDRHIKHKPKETNELDALLEKISIEKKEREQIPSLVEFIKDNPLA